MVFRTASRRSLPGVLSDCAPSNSDNALPSLLRSIHDAFLARAPLRRVLGQHIQLPGRIDSIVYMHRSEKSGAPKVRTACGAGAPVWPAPQHS